MKAATAFYKKNKDSLLLWGMVAVALVCMGTILYSTIFPQRATFYYDSSDTLMWAWASYEGGSLINPDFGYVYLLPFGSSLLMLPFIPIFGLSMTTHIIGMVLFDIIFFASLWFFCRGLDMTNTKRLALFSGVLMILSSSAKLQELMWHHTPFYPLTILFAIVFFGILFRLLPAVENTDTLKSKRVILWAALLFLFAMCVGTDGTTIFVLCTAPVAGALVCERFFDNGKKIFSKSNLRVYGVAVLIAVGTVAGFALLSVLKGGYQSNYSDEHLRFTYAQTWMDHVLLLPSYWVRLLGVNPHSDEKLTDPSALFEFVHLGVAILLVLLPILAAVQYKKIESQSFRRLIWYHFLLSAVLLVNHICGSTADNDWRFIPAVFSSAVVSLLYLMHLWKAPNLRRITALMAALVFAIGAVNIRHIATQPVTNGENTEFYELAQVLEAQGLDYGYGDFYTSHTVTVFTNQEIKIRYVIFDNNGVRPHHHQTMKTWYGDVPGQDRYFIVLKLTAFDKLVEGELSRDGWEALRAKEVDEIYWSDYVIMIFDENPINPDPNA